MTQSKVARSGQADRLSALPDGVLEHVLGFLPAHEAVRTSVLAPRWRSLWKSVRRLHITCPVEDWNEDNVDKLCDFVNSLFLIRGCARLDEVKFNYDAELKGQTDIWVRHALLCQAQLLILHIHGSEYVVHLEGPPLVSSHLRKLELNDVYLKDKFLDFASCPALEVLEISDCDIETQRILSPSVKILRIESSTFHDYQTRISVPSLIWLQLNNFNGRAPLLESMPSLETASVKPAAVNDSCNKGDSGNWCGICAACCGDDDHKGRCVLLGGLSSAVNLELTAYRGMYLFRRDLIWCPTFSKLKTLLLNDWCLAVDLFPLVCILKHSPVLENLTLHLCKGLRFPTQSEGNNTLMEKPAALSRCLKIIKIKCQDVDERVYKLLKFLSTWDIEVTIKRAIRIQRFQ